MAHQFELSLKLADDTDAEAFTAALEAFLADHPGVVIAQQRSWPYSNELQELGLPTQLNTTLQGDRFQVASIDGLCGLTEADLLDPSRGGVKLTSLRTINIRLAQLDPPRALQGNEPIPCDDLMERLALKSRLNIYAVLRRAGLRRLSQITALDVVDVQRLRIDYGTLVDMLRRVNGNDQPGLQLAALKPERTLADLRPSDYTAAMFTDADIRLTTRVGALTQRYLRERLEASMDTADSEVTREGEVKRQLEWMLRWLQDYHIELPA